MSGSDETLKNASSESFCCLGLSSLLTLLPVFLCRRFWMRGRPSFVGLLRLSYTVCNIYCCINAAGCVNPIYTGAPSTVAPNRPLLERSLPDSLLRNCSPGSWMALSGRKKKERGILVDVYLPFYKSTRLVCFWLDWKVTSRLLLQLISPGLGVEESAQRRPVVSVRPDISTSALPLGSIGRPSGLDIAFIILPPAANRWIIDERNVRSIIFPISSSRRQFQSRRRTRDDSQETVPQRGELFPVVNEWPAPAVHSVLQRQRHVGRRRK